ncbi:MAG: outer membrane protein assembly factor BamB family protein [Candidatus Cryosericum sp.]
MRKAELNRLSVIAVLVSVILATAMTGCRNRATPSTVNRTFVDVVGLPAAPTKVVTSYATEDLNLGNDRWAGMPQFLDGTLYTFSYHSDLSQWTTAWNQETGKKLWSVLTNVDTSIVPSAAFTTDGTHLFFVRTDISTLGEPGVVASIACLDKATGTTVWQSTPTVASSFVFGVRSNIAVHIDEQSHTADRIYVIGAEERTSTAVPPTDEVRHPGIWIWDATTGKLQDRIDWVVLSIHPEASGQLLCDGETLFASIPESSGQFFPQQPAYPAGVHSAIVAFDLVTNKAVWTDGASGEATNLIKQGDVLVLPRTAQDYNGKPEYWIDVWKSALPTAPDDTMRLWTHQIDTAPVNFAVDGLHVYVQGAKGMLTAFDLATGTEAWSHPFAPYKTPVTDGPAMGTLYDRYPDMTLTTTRDILYVQDGGGLVAGLDPAMGKELWSKRISHVVWGQTGTQNLFVVRPVDKGFYVVASDGKVDFWK